METIVVTVVAEIHISANDLSDYNGSERKLHEVVNNALVGQDIKVKSGELENLAIGTINGISDISINY